jgi:hypothetical protein
VPPGRDRDFDRGLSRPGAELPAHDVIGARRRQRGEDGDDRDEPAERGRQRSFTSFPGRDGAEPTPGSSSVSGTDSTISRP